MSAAFDMGPAGRVSPLVKTARWTLLIAGIWWGSKRYVNMTKMDFRPKSLTFALFVTSKIEFSNCPILEFKMLQNAFKKKKQGLKYF